MYCPNLGFVCFLGVFFVCGIFPGLVLFFFLVGVWCVCVVVLLWLFLVGYGFGARATVFGYFVKFDYAFGLENKEVKSPVTYLTLGYDF